MRRIARQRVVAAIAAAVTATVAPGVAHATFPGNNGMIAVAGCGSSDCGVFLVAPDGSGATQVTHNPYRIDLPRGGSYPASDGPSSWTPDGQRLLYLRSRGVDDLESRIVAADGSGDEPFPIAPTTQPVFSPDGSTLAFVGYVPPGYPQIYVKDLASGEVTQLTHGTGAYDPDWSPDGTKIAFTQGPGGYGAPEIYVMSSDGSDEVRLTFELNGGAWAFDPSWSPDGAKIAFTHTYQGQQYEIYTMNADGSGLVNLTDNYVGPPDYTRIDDETAAWSPDGRQIAFVRRVGNPLQLMVMNADGGQPSALPAEGAAPVWQALPAPRRSDFKNASSFCKAEREFWGEQAFRQRYGNGRNAHGKCVSQG